MTDSPQQSERRILLRWLAALSRDRAIAAPVGCVSGLTPGPGGVPNAQLLIVGGAAARIADRAQRLELLGVVPLILAMADGSLERLGGLARRLDLVQRLRRDHRDSRLELAVLRQLAGALAAAEREQWERRERQQWQRHLTARAAAARRAATPRRLPAARYRVPGIAVRGHRAARRVASTSSGGGDDDSGPAGADPPSLKPADSASCAFRVRR